MNDFLFSSQFIPHGHCYLWQPRLVGLHILADVLIALAYYSIPLMLVYFVRQRQDLPFKQMFLLFGGFIIACGTTHVMNIWTLWHPTYWLSGLLKALTAVISVATAVELAPLIPKALALPSPTQLEAANQELAFRIQEHKRTEEALRHLKEELELRIAERTSELSIANSTLKGQIHEREQAEEKLKRTAAAAAASEEQFRATFNQAAVGIAQVNLEGKWLLVNQKLCDIVGYSQKELEARTFQDITHPNDLEADLENVHQLLAGKIQTYSMEKRYIRKDGSYVWINLTVALVREPSLQPQQPGKPQYFISVVEDISERKQAEKKLRQSVQRYRFLAEKLSCEINERIHVEERLQASLAATAAAAQEKELLLKEVHHRVKNNLQVVSGLLYLQSRYVNDLPTLTVLKESRDRIQSMALIHEKLYSSKNFDKIDFRDYIQSLVQVICISQSVNTNLISFKVDVEPLYLDINTAIHCGLIINELVSNSLKHAFPSGLSGEITVQFYATKERNFELIVRDNGIGFTQKPDFQQQKSLGLCLVHALATEQLEGTLELKKGKAVIAMPESNSGSVFGSLDVASGSIGGPGADFRICFGV